MQQELISLLVTGKWKWKICGHGSTHNWWGVVLP